MPLHIKNAASSCHIFALLKPLAITGCFVESSIAVWGAGRQKERSDMRQGAQQDHIWVKRARGLPRLGPKRAALQEFREQMQVLGIHFEEAAREQLLKRGLLGAGWNQNWE